MASLKRSAHNVDVARRVKREVQTAVRDLDKIILDPSALRELSGVHKLCCTEFTSPRLFARVGVDSNNPRGFNKSSGGDNT